MQQDFPRKRNLYDGPYPDVTDYTIEDVVKFFKSKGFTKEASAFSEQVSLSFETKELVGRSRLRWVVSVKHQAPELVKKKKKEKSHLCPHNNIRVPVPLTH